MLSLFKTQSNVGKSKFLLFPIFLILCSFFSFGFSTYEYLGQNQYEATDIFTYFNENTNNITKYLKLLSVPTDQFNLYQPLVDDIDNDGIKEIIYIDFQNLYIANISNQRINVEQSFEIYSNTGYYPSSLTIADLNDDNIKEIYYTKDSDVYTLEYDGNSITLNQIYNNSNAYVDPFPVACDEDINKCFTITNEFTGGHLTIIEISYGMTEEHISSFLYEHETFCFIPDTLKIDDLDFDTKIDLVFTGRSTADSGNLRGYLFRAELNSSYDAVEFYSTYEASIGGSYCSQVDALTGEYVSTSNMISSPYISDVIEGGSKEIVWAVVDNVNPDDRKFKIYQYSPTLTKQNTFPLLDTGNGLIVGNIFKAKVFDDTENSFCVMGFNSGRNYTEVVCGSKDTGWSGATRSFGYTATDILLNHASGYTHTSSQMSLQSNVYSIEADSSDYFNEFMTTYGVLKPTNSYLSAFGFYNLERIWANPYEHSSVLPIDYNDDSHNELIVKNNENIIYISDGYTTLGCDEQNCAEEITINPNNNAIWLINTSFEITIKTQEKDNYPVRARVYIYYGTDNEQLDNWTAFYNVGTSLPLGNLFKINKTISAGQIRIELSNNKYPDRIGVIEYPFSVSETNGIVFGEDIAYYNFLGYTEAQAQAQTTESLANNLAIDKEDNIFRTFFDNFPVFSSIGYTAGWLLLMIIFAVIFIYAQFLKKDNRFNKLDVAFAIVGETLLFVMGVYIGFIPVEIMVIVVIIAIAIIIPVYKIYKGG